jgi:xylulokinase/glycerol kinase
MNHIIALDLGTSSMRSILYDENGKSICAFGHEYHSEFPRPSWVEQSPDSWKRAAADVLFRTASFMKDKGLAARGIAVTSQRSSLIPVDKDGRPLRDAIMWQDKRTIAECNGLVREYGLEHLYRLSGLRANPYFVLPKILWLKAHESGIYKVMRKALGVQDYVVYCLTGEYITDYTQAGRTMLMNIEKFQWEEELLRIAGISADRLPRLIPPGSAAGKLTPDFASLTGLPRGLPVAVSGGDQQNAAVALGVTGQGMAEANTGTGSFVIAYAEKPVFDASCRVLLQASAIAGKWVMEAGIFNTGSIYRWFKEQHCLDLKDNPKPYMVMDDEASISGPGARGVMMLPHFEGSAAPYWNPMAKGLFFNLSLGSTRGDMNRAILEGVAMEISDCLELIAELTGNITAVNVAGGMVKSDLFCRIQAGVYDKPVIRYKNSEASSLGACMVSAEALGVHPGLDAASRAMAAGVEMSFQPHAKDVGVYQKLLAAKKKLYHALAESGVYETFMGGPQP